MSTIHGLIATSLALLPQTPARVPADGRQALAPFAVERTAEGASPAPAQDESIRQQTRLRLAPIPGMTSGWHDAPEALSVPAASPVGLELRVPMPHSVRWTGAVETRVAGDSSRADVVEDGTGRTEVLAEILDRAGRVRHTVSFTVDYVPVGPEALRAREIVRQDVRWSEAADSFQVFEEASLQASPALEVAAGEPLSLFALAEDPELESALEWRLDGEPLSLGGLLETSFAAEGTHALAVGPLDSELRIPLVVTAPSSGGSEAFKVFYPGTLGQFCFASSCTLSATVTPGSPDLITIRLKNTSGCTRAFRLEARLQAPTGYGYPASLVKIRNAITLAAGQQATILASLETTPVLGLPGGSGCWATVTINAYAPTLSQIGVPPPATCTKIASDICYCNCPPPK